MRQNEQRKGSATGLDSKKSLASLYIAPMYHELPCFFLTITLITMIVAHIIVIDIKIHIIKCIVIECNHLLLFDRRLCDVI